MSEEKEKNNFKSGGGIRETGRAAGQPEEEVVSMNKISTGDIKKPCILVRSLENSKAMIAALVDTGTPVNLIKKSVWEKLYSGNKLFRIKEKLCLKGVNDSLINVYGKIYDQVKLDQLLGEICKIKLLVVDDGTMQYDMLLGREFFNEANLKVSYQKGEFNVESCDKNNEKIEKILPINAIEKRDLYDIVSENLDEGLKTQVRNELIQVLQEIHNLKVEPKKDGYCVKVHIKDNSLYRYAPRRMSIMEKTELDTITDNLLKRGIIKPSISPYCARMVLVTKRNGKKRMCVDLRHLNQRIDPQKFPFLILEDQLDKLYNKKYFTKLDLRDSLHQIDIHPDDTKYFAFATPSGQFEYLKLPFGYSEAAAEFQKRILYIFQPLFRNNEVLVYVDDILIATETVEENLLILKKVLVIIKAMDLN